MLEAYGEPPYRGRQIAAWVYRKGVRSFEAMTDLPAALRQRLDGSIRVGSLTLHAAQTSADGAVKYAFRLHDGNIIESVYLPYTRYVSACLSTQVGCPAGCAFCATGRLGLIRNLDAGEIVEQYLLLQSNHPNRRISHVVFMGMGEPLLNVDETVEAARLLTTEVQLSARNLTISTVGVVPGIRRLAESGLRVNLAISVNAPDDTLRQQLVPTARKWPLKEILDAAAEFRNRTGRDVTYEYVLLGDVNDSVAHARELVRALRGYHGAVNLIPYNPVEGLGNFRTPSADAVAAFRAVLEREGRAVTVRQRRGHDIAGACGQLAGRPADGMRRPRRPGPDQGA